jgi:hypothetical protein
MLAGNYVTASGEIIGDDGEETEYVFLLTEPGSIKTVSGNKKKGKSTKTSEVKIAFTTTETEIQEAINVLDRTIANGGFAEECSVVIPEGKVFEGKKGLDVREGQGIATFPHVEGNDNTSIHSHQTGTTEKSAWSASKPGPGDPLTFQDFNRNIIVGPLGIAKTLDGKDVPRSNGAAFFGRNALRDSKPKVEMTKQALINSLKKKP